MANNASCKKCDTIELIMMKVAIKKRSDNLEWHSVPSPNKKARAVLFANKGVEFLGLHIS